MKPIPLLISLWLAASLLLGYHPHALLFQEIEAQLIWYLLSFLPMLALWFVHRNKPLSRGDLVLFFVAGLSLRVFFSLQPVALSTDIFRYIWEGRVVNAGLDPYMSAPNDPSLASLRAEYPEHASINHPSFRSVYPPNAMSLFRLAALFDTPLAFSVFKLLLVFAEVILLLLLSRNLPRMQLYLLLYWVCPLPIIELAGSGHLDIFAITLLCAAYLSWQRDWASLAGALWSASLLVKPYGAPLLLFFLYPSQGRWLHHWLRFGAGGIIAALACLPYWESLPSLAANLSAFGEKLKFNAGPFELFFWIGELLSDSSPQTRWYDAMQFGTRLVVVISLLALLYLCARLHRSKGQDMALCSYWMLCVGLFLSPQVHPWYLLVVIIVGLLAERRALLLASPLIVLSYWTYIEWHGEGIWNESVWLRVMAFGGLSFFFLREERRR
jgi:alpha-1,6-mannosyltransferase